MTGMFISFDGLNQGVSIDLSSASADTEWDVTARVNDAGQAVVAYVDGAEGIFGTDYGDSLSEMLAVIFFMVVLVVTRSVVDLEMI